MNKTLLYFLLLILFLPNNSPATSPCVQPERQWLIDNVVRKSDTVIYAEVTNYSDVDNNSFLSKLRSKIAGEWTEVRAKKVLLGDLKEGSEVTIKGWQSKYMPLYNYDKGSLLLLWLKKDGEQYSATDLNWDRCVPSVEYIRDESVSSEAIDSANKLIDEIR